MVDPSSNRRAPAGPGPPAPGASGRPQAPRGGPAGGGTGPSGRAAAPPTSSAEERPAGVGLESTLAADSDNGAPDDDSAVTWSDDPGASPRGGPDGDGTFARGALVGRYVVLSRLGAGAMGVVYAAYDPELDRKVALKLLKPRRAASAQAAEGQRRLLREAQAMAKLTHPNVVTVHDVGEHGSRVYVAMEFVDGRPLTSWTEHEHPWRATLDIFAEAGRGLAAAHAKGLVHRDFKPDNVMVGANGRVRVMDFGLARASDLDAPAEVTSGALPEADLRGSSTAFDAEVTRAGAIVGTPAYMAPE